MSWENLKDAYRTRLGNLTAKSVLVLIVDEANAEGLAFVGLDRVSALTEINKRTTLRIVQVFGEIDLVSRTEATLKGTMRPAFQVNLAKLGLNLCEPFREAYAVACGKCHSDIEASVAVTRRSVAETPRSVTETLPPHPLNGRSPLVPLLFPTPKPPQAGAAGSEPSIEAAVDQVRIALAIANRRKIKLLEDVIRMGVGNGEEPADVAQAMIAAWRKKGELSWALRPCGMDKFFGLGLWRNESQWYWDNDAIRERKREREARVGS